MLIFLAFLRFFSYLCTWKQAFAAASKTTPKAKSFMSFGGRRKIFARPPQDIAPPAATICHGRGKLVTSRLAPCYIPSKSLFPRGSSPFRP